MSFGAIALACQSLIKVYIFCNPIRVKISSLYCTVSFYQVFGYNYIYFYSSSFTIISRFELPKSFNSARWKKGYNPYLIFASESIANMCKKSVMDPIPHTQHRPICVSVQPVVVPQPTPFRRRFNFRKAD